jgi:thiol-disulfide isomerase/thioredoxin
MIIKQNWLKKGLIWGRDIIIFCVLFYAVLAFQNRNMLDPNDDIVIAPLTLVTLDHDKHTIAPVEGKQTLIYFFAPWCSVCRASINNLEYVNQQTTQVVIIALDYADQNEVQRFVDDVGLKLPVYLGYNDMKSLFQISAYPSYYLLDDTFKLTGKAMGYSTVLELFLKSNR